MEEIVWIEPNFLELLTDTTTTKFQFVNNEPGKDKFSIIMRLFGHDNDMIEMYYMTPYTVSLTFELKTYNSASKPSYCMKIGENTDCHTVQAGRWQYISSYSKKIFISHYLKGNVLHLKFLYKMKVLDDKTSVMETIEKSNYLNQLLSNGLFSDIITIKSAEGNEHKVHKDLLAVRSPVFKAQFEHNTIECQTHTIETHLGNEVLAEVITFIYSNKVSSVGDMPKKLLAAADFYQISQLKQLCETALHETLSTENAIDTLFLADLYSAETLKKLTLEFIKCQPHIVVKDEIWAELKSVELLKALCKCFLDTNVLLINTS